MNKKGGIKALDFHMSQSCHSNQRYINKVQFTLAIEKVEEQRLKAVPLLELIKQNGQSQLISQ